MKSSTASEQSNDALEPKYQFDYRTAKPNRFAEQLQDGQIVVVLEHDMAAVFRSSEDVNLVLPALIQSMP